MLKVGGFFCYLVVLRIRSCKASRWLWLASIRFAMLTPAISETMLPSPAAAKVERPNLAPKTASISLPATSCTVLLSQFCVALQIANCRDLIWPWQTGQLP